MPATPMTKAAMIAEIARRTGLTKEEVSLVLDELSIIIERHLRKRGPGQFKMPGLFKIEVEKYTAAKARSHKTSHYVGKQKTIKAKVVRRLKVKPLNRLKRAVQPDDGPIGKD